MRMPEKDPLSFDTATDNILLKIDAFDTGEYSEIYNICNIITDDSSVFCSSRKAPLNILLSPCEIARPFFLKGLKIRIPSFGFTSPLENGYVFALDRMVDFDTLKHDLAFFDIGFTVSSLPQIRALHPSIPSYVKSCLFFHLDSSKEEFSYEYRNVIYPVSFVLFKLLSTSGTHENVDISYFGLYGSTHGLGVGEASWL